MGRCESGVAAKMVYMELISMQGLTQTHPLTTRSAHRKTSSAPFSVETG